MSQTTPPNNLRPVPQHLHVVHTIMAGNKHGNVLPPGPEGREIARIWTLMDEEKLRQIGPVHNVSAFLEDRNHDWRIDSQGGLRYFSRVTETDRPTQIVLDYETDPERDLRVWGRVRPASKRPKTKAKLGG